MDMIVQFVIVAGIAAFVPRPAGHAQSWFGARFAFAGHLVVIYLFIGNVVIGISLSSLVGALIAAGSAAAGLALVRLVRNGSVIANAGQLLIHPVVVFAAMALATSAFRGGVGYQPYLGDEVASWLNLTRQIFLADHYWSSEMDYPLVNYSNGWPMLLAAASGVYGTFSESHAVPVVLFLHLGLIGFTFDYLLYKAQEVVGMCSLAYLIAWIGCLIMLAGEVTYRLLATDLLIEHPVVYGYALCFLLAILGMESGARHYRLCVYLSVVVAAGYLFKVSILAAAPAIALIVLVFVWRTLREAGAAAWLDGRRGDAVTQAVAMLAIVFVPITVLIVIWHFASMGDQLTESLGPVQHGDWSLLVSAGGGELLLRMALALLDYGAIFKLPLTIVTLVVAIAALMSRYSAVTLAFLLYFAATVAGLYIYYIYRSEGIETGYLESFPRFMMVPIRVLHFIGLVLLTVWAIAAFPWSRMSAVPLFRPMLAVLLVAGLGWQAFALNKSLVDIADRRFQEQTNIRAVYTFKRRSEQLIEEVSRRGLDRPTVGVIDLRGYDVARSVADYYSLKTRREGRFYRHFVPQRARTVAAWGSFDILWPVTFHEPALAALHALLRACGYDGPPDRVFLFKAHSGYDCVPVKP